VQPHEASSLAGKVILRTYRLHFNLGHDPSKWANCVVAITYVFLGTTHVLGITLAPSITAAAYYVMALGHLLH
jgi:hypothetical protein